MHRAGWFLTGAVGFVITALSVAAAGQDPTYLWVGAVVFLFLAAGFFGFDWFQGRYRPPPPRGPRNDGIYIGGGHVVVGGEGNTVSGNTFNTVLGAPPPEDISAVEYRRQQDILRRLYSLYLNSHDGITPEMASSIAPLPKAWVDAELTKMGETWRREEYRI